MHLMLFPKANGSTWKHFPLPALQKICHAWHAPQVSKCDRVLGHMSIAAAGSFQHPVNVRNVHSRALVLFVVIRNEQPSTRTPFRRCSGPSNPVHYFPPCNTCGPAMPSMILPAPQCSPLVAAGAAANPQLCQAPAAVAMRRALIEQVWLPTSGRRR